MEQNTSHDIFTDPAIIKAKKDDPFFNYINSNWREILMMAAILLGGYYVVTRLQQSYYQSKVASADVLKKAQDSFSEVVALQNKLFTLSQPVADSSKDTKDTMEARDKERTEIAGKLRAAKTGLTQRLAALEDQKAPYSGMAPLFEATLNSVTGELKTAQAAVDTLKGQESSGPGAVLVSELAQLGLARSKLDSADLRAEGFNSLLELTKNSEFVAVSAASTLSRTAGSVEEKSLAQAAIQARMAKSPQQTDMLQMELNVLGAQ